MAFGKRQKVIAIAVTAIIILAGGAFILSIQKPEQSISEKMTLEPSDLDMPGWVGSAARPSPLSYTNESSQYEMNMANSTIDLDIGVLAFNSSQDSHAAFLEIRSSMNPSGQGHVDISLGDEAFYWLENARHHVVFTKGNVVAWLVTEPLYLEQTQAWQYNATMNLAQLQLEKIDRYLAS